MGFFECGAVALAGGFREGVCAGSSVPVATLPRSCSAVGRERQTASLDRGRAPDPIALRANLLTLGRLPHHGRRTPLHSRSGRYFGAAFGYSSGRRAILTGVPRLDFSV